MQCTLHAWHRTVPSCKQQSLAAHFVPSPTDESSALHCRFDTPCTRMFFYCLIAARICSASCSAVILTIETHHSASHKSPALQKCTNLNPYRLPALSLHGSDKITWPSQERDIGKDGTCKGSYKTWIPWKVKSWRQFGLSLCMP